MPDEVLAVNQAFYDGDERRDMDAMRDVGSTPTG